MTVTKKFQVVYYQHMRFRPIEESHRYWESWDKTEQYCVNCGMHGVWRSQSEDYEAGPTLMCTDCGFRHTINFEREDCSRDYPDQINNQDKQRIDALRSDER